MDRLSPWLAVGLTIACGCGRGRFDAVANSDAAGDGDGAVAGDSAVGGDGAVAGDAVLAADTCQFHPSAVFCDGFEADLSAWTASTGAVASVTAPIHGGVGALRASIPASPTTASVRVTLPDLSAATQLYLRMWLYVPSGPTLAHVDFVELLGTGSEAISIYGFNELLEVYLRSSTGNSYAGGPLKRAAWVCTELNVSISDTAGTLELVEDGTSVILQTNVDTNLTGGIRQLYVGITYAGATQTGPLDALIDDVVLDTAPIGCAP